MNNSPSSLVRPSAPQERLRIIQAGALTWRQSAGLRLSRLRVDAGADARRRCKCRSPVVAAGINSSSPRCSVCLRRVERGCLAAPPLAPGESSPCLLDSLIQLLSLLASVSRFFGGRACVCLCRFALWGVFVEGRVGISVYRLLLVVMRRGGESRSIICC